MEIADMRDIKHATMYQEVELINIGLRAPLNVPHGRLPFSAAEVSTFIISTGKVVPTITKISYEFETMTRRILQGFFYHEVSMY